MAILKFSKNCKIKSYFFNSLPKHEIFVVLGPVSLISYKLKLQNLIISGRYRNE